MPESLHCITCGAAIAADAPAALCPHCLLRTALESGADVLGPPAEIIAALPRIRYFGDYELVEEISRGGMGVVFRARQITLNRLVALKMMRPGLLATAEEVRRFRTEAQLAAGLHHPNIVAIHEAGEQDGLHYFSMELIEGMSLAEVVRSQPLEPKQAARLVRRIAEAIHYAHTNSVLHRDLKPSNVILDLAGEPHVADFGLARSIHSDITLTLTGAVIGTPAYMPPEQAGESPGVAGVPADVYSMGAILFELLTGRAPFIGPPLDILQRIRDTAPPAPRSLVPRIPRDLETICLKCLAKDPRHRYDSAQSLAADLERFMAGLPIHASPASPVRRIWHWCRRHPLRAAACAAVAIAVVCAPLARNALLSKRNPPRQANSFPSLPAPLTPAEMRLAPAAADPIPAPPARTLPGGYRPIMRFRIEILAGGDLGDGGPATAASLPEISYTAAAGNGDLFIADNAWHTIRRIDAGGIITRIAGSGEWGGSPDGIQARGAALFQIMGMAADSAGNLYFSEASPPLSGDGFAWCKVRKISVDGRLSTIANFDPCRFDADVGPALANQRRVPGSLAVAADGSLLVAERDGPRILRVTPSGAAGIVAGNGSTGEISDGVRALDAPLRSVFKIAADAAGNIFIAQYPCRVLRISPEGLIYNVPGSDFCAQGTSATRGRFSYMEADAAGNLYLAAGTQIRKLQPDGAVSTIANQSYWGAPSREGNPAEFEQADSVILAAGPRGRLYVAEPSRKHILAIDSSSTVSEIAGSTSLTDEMPAARARFNEPIYAIAGRGGEIFVSDMRHMRIRRIGRDGLVSTIAGNGLGWQPAGSSDGTPALSAAIGRARGMALDRAGNLFVANPFGIVWKIASNGLSRVAGGGANVTSDGVPARDAHLESAESIAIDAAGTLYVVDARSHAILRVSPTGAMSRVVGGGRGFAGDGGPAVEARLWSPSAVAPDSSGNLYIADILNARIRRVAADGTIDTFAGTGRPKHSGDGGPAIEAGIAYPTAVAADAFGNVYFAEIGSGRIRWISPDGIIRTAARAEAVYGLSVDENGALLVVESGKARILRLIPEY